MSRTLAACVTLFLAVAVMPAPAQAGQGEYVILNAEGLEKVLLEESWGPAWFGPVDGYSATATMSGARPEVCSVKGKSIKGTKSAAHADMGMDFQQSKANHLLVLNQHVYQYADVKAADSAWQELTDLSTSCAGKRTETIVENGKKVGTLTLITQVFVRPSMYGQDQVIINVDMQIDEPQPGGSPTRESADQISIFTYTGAAIVEVEAYKDVPKRKKWVFSEPQVATMETLALLAIQRYHLAAYKAL